MEQLQEKRGEEQLNDVRQFFKYHNSISLSYPILLTWHLIRCLLWQTNFFGSKIITDFQVLKDVIVAWPLDLTVQFWYHDKYHSAENFLILFRCDMDEKKDEEESTMNEGEAAVAIAHAKRLVESGVHSTDIGIIAPYAAQV